MRLIWILLLLCGCGPRFAECVAACVIQQEPPAVCGDGFVGVDEECDDGYVGPGANGDGCDENCTITRCGNGIIQDPESCEPSTFADGCDYFAGFTAPGEARCTDGCDIDLSDCTLRPGFVRP
jgi:cysteine-rich repeat protein